MHFQELFEQIQFFPRWFLPSFSIFPLDGIYPLNSTNWPPKTTHQQHLLRDFYQNNATVEKEALNDDIGETNMASKFNKS